MASDLSVGMASWVIATSWLTLYEPWQSRGWCYHLACHREALSCGGFRGGICGLV